MRQTLLMSLPRQMRVLVITSAPILLHYSLCFLRLWKRGPVIRQISLKNCRDSFLFHHDGVSLCTLFRGFSRLLDNKMQAWQGRRGGGGTNGHLFGILGKDIACHFYLVLFLCLVKRETSNKDLRF